MKNLLVVILFLASPVYFIEAQVSINTTGDPPDNSAILDVKSVNKGVLIPRLTQSQIASISSPANGLLVYCVTDGKLYIYVKISAEWKEVAYGGSVISPPAFTCGSTFTVSHVASEGVAPVDKTVAYGTVTNLPGEPSKCWITQNLGATHQATSETDATDESAGWFWEFNRKQGYYFDGSTRNPATAWVTPIDENLDWQSAEDPCAIELGNGWRIPSYTEWNNVKTGGSWSVRTDLWNSGLKLHAAGGITTNGAELFARGEGTYYWSTPQESTVWGIALRCTGSEPVILAGTMKTTGIPIRCVQGTSTPGLAVVTTAAATDITGTSATSGGNVISEGSGSVTARGVCWSTSSAPTTSDSHTMDGSGTGTFTSYLTGLTPNTLHYVRAYATNSYGTAYGEVESFTPFWACGSSLTITHTVLGGVAPVDKTVTYGTVTAIPGEPTKCWITSNLGADHQAIAVDDATEASAGWYWQFNRKQGYKHDGTTVTPSWTITSIDENSDWTAANDPCTLELGSGWRIPTLSEWYNVDAIGYWEHWDGPWNSGLKLHGAGCIVDTNGLLYWRGSIGHNWSSTQNSGILSSFMYFQVASSNIDNSSKAHGFSLRCIKD